jgi:aspartyl/asparaginyl beta-hydroxylase (cupin superfamily)
MNGGEKEVEALLARASFERQRGQSIEELRLLESALQLAPADPRVLNARGMRALADSDAIQAQICFAAASASDPGEPALWMNLATACRALRDAEGEQESLQRVLELNRRHFVAQLRMAELHERKGQLADAAQSWSAVVQMASSSTDRPPLVEDALRRGQAFIASHNQRLSQALAADLGEKLSTPGVAARRFKVCVEHSLGGRPIYRNECAGVYYPFLPADEFFDREHFPWFANLEAKTDVIREEALALLARDQDVIRPYVRLESGTPENKWSPLDQSLDWSACFLWEYGQRNDQVCALCPETAAALEALPQNHVPGKAPSAFFSILRPGAHIPAHTGVTNTRAIIHLPLVVPPGCKFRVGGDVREWKVGEAFAFDDTIEHEAWNSSGEPRTVLIFDVWNPHLTEEEQELVARFFEITTQERSG